jgi:hypothetical protein
MLRNRRQDSVSDRTVSSASKEIISKNSGTSQMLTPSNGEKKTSIAHPCMHIPDILGNTTQEGKRLEQAEGANAFIQRVSQAGIKINRWSSHNSKNRNESSPLIKPPNKIVGSTQ